MTGQRVETLTKSELANAPAMDGHAVIWKPFQVSELLEAVGWLTSDRTTTRTD
jgi:hypothetical protein